MKRQLTEKLLSERCDGNIWRGQLSPSAISTATSAFALSLYQNDNNDFVANGVKWLKDNMRDDGAWGDSPESPPNMTATLLSYAAIYALDKPDVKTVTFLENKFGKLNADNIVKGVLAYYGKDLTFSVPILVMCSLAGILHDWKKIPFFPFELALLPQSLFRFLRLPVVSYAIPAFIAMGLLCHKKRGGRLMYKIREQLINRALRRLSYLQPSDGGFLEAAPLTSFVLMCLCGAGFGKHTSATRAAEFLIQTQRSDGSWPIDTDLAGWVTALAIKALRDDIPDADKAFLLNAVKRHAFKTKHPFTGAAPGGWGWTDLPGAVPDADDTAANLIALHILNDGKYCQEAENGVKWLLGLQNSDGGMPTFCKGWGKLPFDRSSPDISAHSLAAIELWRSTFDRKLQKQCGQALERLLRWIASAQSDDGSWTPLWFGDQDTDDELSPVYGTAVTVEHLCASHHPLARTTAMKGAEYLQNTQNSDGGWGGRKGVRSKIIITARALNALSALCGFCGFCGLSTKERLLSCITSASEWLYKHFTESTLDTPEPVGLYFARLWYSEKMYNQVFVLDAVKNLVLIKKNSNFAAKFNNETSKN